MTDLIWNKKPEDITDADEAYTEQYIQNESNKEVAKNNLDFAIAFGFKI